MNTPSASILSSRVQRRGFVCYVGHGWRWMLAAVVMTGMVSCVTTDMTTIAPPVADGSAQLARGRHLYLTSCTKCHAPEPVTNYTRAEWSKIMPEMVEETNLNAADAAAVTAYVEHTLRR